MSEKNYVVNVKTKLNTIITVRGDSAEELAQNIGGFVNNGLNDHIGALEELLLGSSNVPQQVAVAQSAVNLVADTLGATVIDEQPITPSFTPVPPPQAAPVAAGGVDTIEDRWGNKWTYGRADAPVCPNGPMVLKQGTNQAGKSYVGWFDPAGGPRWQGAKVPSGEQTAPKFGVKV